MNIDPKLWKKAKIYAIRHDITVSGLVEKLLIEKIVSRKAVNRKNGAEK